MDKLVRFLAFAWILSLPFYRFSIFGSLSIDNLLAPLLLVIVMLRLVTGKATLKPYQISNLLKAMFVGAVYFFTHTIGLASTQQAVFSSAYATASNMLYFILPIMLIKSVKDMERFNDAIIVIACVASLTALLSALGILNFDFLRFAESRIGVEYLQKSVGLFTSYGDAGVLLSFSLVLVFAGRKSRVLFGPGSNTKVLLVLITSLIGLASMQSRNIVLTIVTTMVSYWLLGRWMKQSRFWHKKLYIAVVVSIFAIVVVTALFSGPLLDFVRGIGGTKEAAGTVDARLAQYAFMWDLVKDNIIFGIPSDVYERNALAVIGVHNFWLKELVQGGLITVVGTGLVWWYALTAQVKNYRRGIVVDAPRAYIATLLGMLVATQFYPGGTLIFWALLGVCTAQPFGNPRPAEKPGEQKQGRRRSSGSASATEKWITPPVEGSK